MILTVTMNPSVDISYPLDHLGINQVNRCKLSTKTAGGKGLNVTKVIHQMDERVVCTGLVGGALGEFIKERLDDEKIHHHFLTTHEETRNCIAILHDNGKQTEILETGPTITKVELQRFEEVISKLVTESNVVTLSGSLPKGVPESYYSILLEQLKNEKVKVVLDSSGESLKAVLKSPFKPYAIKPNFEELQDLTNSHLTTETDDLKEVLEYSLFDGIDLIVVSLGENGAFVKFKQSFYKVSIPQINVVNSVGSGDATVAGLAIGLNNNNNIENTLKIAMTLGLLNTMETKTGHINKDKFEKYFKRISINKI